MNGVEKKAREKVLKHLLDMAGKAFIENIKKKKPKEMELEVSVMKPRSKEELASLKKRLMGA